MRVYVSMCVAQEIVGGTLLHNAAAKGFQAAVAALLSTSARDLNALDAVCVVACMCVPLTLTCVTA